jgi:hypothetical protein
MKILFALIVLTSSAQAQQPWKVSKSINALTGILTTTAYTYATDYDGDKDKEPKLVVRQSGKTCELFVSVPYTVLNEYARVRYDSGKIESPGSNLAADSTAVFLKRQIGQLETASTMVVEYEPSQETRQAVTFDIHGLPAQFDSCAVSERQNAAEEKTAASREAAAERKKAAAERKAAAAEQKEAADAAEHEKDFAEMKASAEAQKRKELCDLPSFASDPKFCAGVGVPVQK